MAKLRHRKRRRLRSSAHRLQGCPLTRNLTGWCYGTCVPHDGLGHCGRHAPHAILGRTQRAILAHRARMRATDVA